MKTYAPENVLSAHIRADRSDIRGNASTGSRHYFSIHTHRCHIGRGPWPLLARPCSRCNAVHVVLHTPVRTRLRARHAAAAAAAAAALGGARWTLKAQFLGLETFAVASVSQLAAAGALGTLTAREAQQFHLIALRIGALTASAEPLDGKACRRRCVDKEVDRLWRVLQRRGEEDGRTTSHERS